MPLAEARALAAVHCETHDPRADNAALKQLAAWCEEFSPIVGIEPPDNLCLEVAGSAALFGGEESIVRQVVRAFQRRGLTIHAALADTLEAAWALANHGQEFPVAVAPGGTTAALAGLPVIALRLPGELAETLRELGIERIDQLLTLRRDALTSRFGPQLLRRLDQATGLVPETIASYRPSPEIVAGMKLEYPIDNRSHLETILRQLAERVALSLAKRQQGAIQIECRLECEGAAPVTFLVGLFRASADAGHLLELTRMELERVRLAGPVIAIRLSVLTAVPWQPRQEKLFESSGCADCRQVELLVDRLSSRIGHGAVVRALPQSETQPELAFRYEPLVGVRPWKRKEQRWKPLPRPMLLEHKLVPLEVLSVIPGSPPVQFHWHGCHRVAHAWGPERIQTGWWRRRYVQRDYYRIETTEGKRFWIFRRLHDARWFLHGVFD